MSKLENEIVKLIQDYRKYVADGDLYSGEARDTLELLELLLDEKVFNKIQPRLSKLSLAKEKSND